MLPSSTPKRAVVLITAALLGGYLIHDPSHLLSSPAPDVDIVLSSYREDPALVARQIEVLRTNLSQKQLSSRVTLYVKDESLSPNATEALRQQVGADRVHKLPNLGREGGTL